MRWSPCPEAPGFECATLGAPLDHRSPGGRTIELAVIKRKATGPGRRIGTLFFNPGGPGGPGTTSLPLSYDQFPEKLRQRFDIVSWDPRGVGDSTAVRCFDSTEEAYAWQSRIPAGFPVGEGERKTWVEAYAELGRRCEERDPQLLRHISTADTARDLDRLREAVGDRQLSYLGVSYGTLLGATYANLFPDRVRAMVLDSNVDPEGWVNRGSKSEPLLGTFQRDGSDLSSAATLKQFLVLCGRAGTDRCSFAAGSPEATRTKFDRLMRRLQQQPLDTWTYGRTVGTVLDSLYFVHPQWTALADTLQELWQGRTPQESPPPPGPPPYPAYEQIDAVRCSESPNPRDPRRYPSLEEFSYARAGDVGRPVAWATEPCATWPATAADPYTGPWNRPTAHPVLVVNTTFDPATPYQGAVDMTRELADARLLTLNGYGHSALVNASTCVNDHESRYLIDGVLPPSGATCEQDTPPFAKPQGGVDTGGGALAGPRAGRRATAPQDPAPPGLP
ncbi:alpha/beta hydrolase [Streptomyces sp. NPDC057445]|uniref:alpha/beta hydrolase n=1 Tax=Streptomyces sp. NPDC057445 TaxID=3346136 RepID=UPI0036A7605C